MIELFIRTFYPTFPSRDFDDELIYRGEDRAEAICCLEEFPLYDNQIVVWDEIPIEQRENSSQKRVAFYLRRRYTHSVSRNAPQVLMEKRDDTH